MAQHLTAAEKRKIEKLYLSGVKPGEIAHKIGIKSASLRQYLYREGLTSRREEIKESKQQTAFEVLARIREKNLADFEAVLGLVAEGLKIDAQKLKNAWNLVGNAADASSLQRAKGLHFDRVLRVYGLDTKLGQVQPATFNIAMLVASPSKPGPVNVTPTDPEPPESSKAGESSAA
ncbi:MAG: hypothetical protein ABSA05_09695 [Opitutaceae bacterium]|jgi:hypothetical protein